MGLIKAGMGAVGGVLSDQWREFFYCDALPENVLIRKGAKRISGRSTNVSGEDNIISNGSVIAVNAGQALLIVQQGRIVEFSCEPGEFIWDSSSEPSLFTGNFGKSLLESFKNVGQRFSFGGGAGKDQRIYFVNLLEITNNKYGTANPVPFRVVDARVGLDLEIGLKCFGVYSYRITDPLLFYTRVAGNVTGEYTRDRLEGQLRSELLTALQPCFGRLSAKGIRYSEVALHTTEITELLNEELTEKWVRGRGISVESFGISSVTANEEDEKIIKDVQRTAVYSNPGMAAAALTTAQADAMRAAASNEAVGPMFAFAGMNMAQNAGGMNAQNLFQMQAQQMQAQQMQQQAQQQPAPAAPAADSWTCACGAVNTGKFCAQCGAKKPEPKPAADSWKCSCGAVNTGKFCAQCGSPKPVVTDEGWVCACGSVNKGKFCPECGAKKPAGIPQYRCDKCGWEPADKAHPPKFCPECGDPFDDGDMQ